MQASLEDLGTPLSHVTFLVVDVETTGGAPGAHALTEIGAVKVRGGRVLEEFSTLVNPGAAIPAQITMLTGITNAMVAGAPAVSAAMEAFLTWADGAAHHDAAAPREETVLVAHNARFDLSHLRAAAQHSGQDWSAPRVLDTLALARRAWSRSDVPNHRLSTLASFVGSPTRPTHRALDDARATVEVLHAALEALAPLGVTHLEDLATATDPVPARRRAKSRLADPLPTCPGVYQFCSAAGQVLYVGSASSLKRRVRSYFTAAEKRRKVAQMLDTTVEVRHIATPTLIEARVRELRLIAELDPPVNRRSRSPGRQPWLRLAPGPQPRLSLTTVLPTSEATGAVGPFASRRSAQEALRAAESVLRLGRWDGAHRRVRPDDAPATADQAAACLSGHIDLVATPLLERISALAADQRYEEAGAWTHRLRALLHGVLRAERARPLLACPHLIAARRRQGGGWELIAVRWGMLAGSMATPPGADPRPGVEALRASARIVERPERVGQGASVEETLLLADWALDEGARLVEVEGDPQCLAWPLGAAARHRKVLDAEP
ncbi:DEDD exonuclease domain-containing protein [Actinomyces capricornis]|uniref:DEDD exonuclease domain-containing protein n=1 Tax=Actinomyces capricornis TaxID=2755559 RepID=UPI001CC7608B|nr:DEDD exonuclease domain-containing protein [Actinomyces capricornis]